MAQLREMMSRFRVIKSPYSVGPWSGHERKPQHGFTWSKQRRCASEERLHTRGAAAAGEKGRVSSNQRAISLRKERVYGRGTPVTPAGRGGEEGFCYR